MHFLLSSKTREGGWNRIFVSLLRFLFVCCLRAVARPILPRPRKPQVFPTRLSPRPRNRSVTCISLQLHFFHDLILVALLVVAITIITLIATSTFFSCQAPERTSSLARPLRRARASPIFTCVNKNSIEITKRILQTILESFKFQIIDNIVWLFSDVGPSENGWVWARQERWRLGTSATESVRAFAVWPRTTFPSTALKSGKVSKLLFWKGFKKVDQCFENVFKRFTNVIKACRHCRHNTQLWTCNNVQSRV